MNSNLETKQHSWVKWALIFGLWTVPALLTTVQLYIQSSSGSAQLSFFGILILQLLIWYVWVALTPLIFRFGRRFRFEHRRWLHALLFHLPASIIIVLIYIFSYALLYTIFKQIPVTTSQLLSTYLGFLIRFFQWHFLIYWAILGFGHAIDFYSKYREGELHASQLETQLAQAQLQALKMQLHPHFIFNTLHAIAVLVRKRNNSEAVHMLTGLGDLLRYILENGGTQEVSLKEELDFLERYLEIEQIRFQDRLKVKMTIEPETLGARVPNLILQPLVENAIRHGIAQRTSSGLIEINARHKNALLEVQVRDDGPGLPDDNGTDVQEGVGLKNTRSRLQKLYGDTYQFQLTHARGGGVLVTLKIPFLPINN